VYISGYDILGIATEALGPIIRKQVDEPRFLEQIARILPGTDESRY
jgi:hypothetical protein